MGTVQRRSIGVGVVRTAITTTLCLWLEGLPIRRQELSLQRVSASEPYATVVDQLATGCRQTLANWAAAFLSPAYAFSGVVVDASVVEVASDIAPQSPLGLSGGNAFRYTLCCGRQFYTIRLCRLWSKAQGGKHANCGSSNQHFPHGSLLSSGRGALFLPLRTSNFTAPSLPRLFVRWVWLFVPGLTAVTARAPLTHV